MDGTAPIGQRRAKHRGVRGGASPVRRALADDQPSPGDHGKTTPLRRDRSGRSSFSVERAEQFHQVDEVSLEFDHEDGASPRVPSEEIDAPRSP